MKNVLLRLWVGSIKESWASPSKWSLVIIICVNHTHFTLDIVNVRFILLLCIWLRLYIVVVALWILFAKSAYSTFNQWACPVPSSDSALLPKFSKLIAAAVTNLKGRFYEPLWMYHWLMSSTTFNFKESLGTRFITMLQAYCLTEKKKEKKKKKGFFF